MWRIEHERSKEDRPEDDQCAGPSPCATCGQRVAEPEPSEADAALREAFWHEREATAEWTVPMGRDLELMPWVGARGCGMLEAMQRARRLHGKVPLLIDNTRDRVVDTFFEYRAAHVLEAKQICLDERTGRRTRALIMEDNRKQLVHAMRYGRTLYIRCANVACPWTSRYVADDRFPLAVFDQRAADTLREEHSIPGPATNLFGSAHPLAAALRVADTEHGVFIARVGFEVVVSTHFARDEYAHWLSKGLPLGSLQAIVPLVAGDEAQAVAEATEACPRRESESEPSVGEGARAGGGGDGVRTTGSEMYPSREQQAAVLEEARAAAQRLGERVDALRSRT